MDASSDSDCSDLDTLISVAYNRLEVMSQDRDINHGIQEKAVLSFTVDGTASNTDSMDTDDKAVLKRSKVQSEQLTKKSRPEPSTVLEYKLPQCDLMAMCNDSLEKEVSSSLLLKSGLAKVRSLPSEQSMRQVMKDRRKEREMTKGKGWFDLSAPVMTEEKKNDLMVLQMRKVLDPKRFYKGSDLRGSLPKYFQMGTVVESAADFYGSRIPNKKRKLTLVDELLHDAEFRRYNKKRYEEVQATQQTTRRSKAHRHMKRQKKNKK